MDNTRSCLRRILLITAALCFAFAATFRGAFAQSHIHFITLSDIHYASSNSSNDGSDSGDDLLKLSLTKMRSLSNNAAFILYLGDLPKHLFGYSSKKGEYEATVFHGLLAADDLKIPMFYISGNNDSIGGNYQPFLVDGKSPLNYAKGWDGACVNCRDLLIDARFMRNYGYYSSYVIPGNKEVLLVVLNATQWMRPRLFTPDYPNQDADATMQLDWLQQQLASHHAKQLLVAMHEPPGMDYKGKAFWKKAYLQRFKTILQNNYKRYGEISLITSHTHMDELRKLTLAGGKAIYAISTPSVSRIYHNNAAMKVFDLDKNDRISNFTTYYTPSNQQWDALHYRALGGEGAIFPQCHQPTLAQCLDSLSEEQVCDRIEQGLFYGVKSLRVNNGACRLVFHIPS